MLLGDLVRVCLCILSETQWLLRHSTLCGTDCCDVFLFYVEVDRYSSARPLATHTGYSRFPKIRLRFSSQRGIRLSIWSSTARGRCTSLKGHCIFFMINLPPPNFQQQQCVRSKESSILQRVCGGKNERRSTFLVLTPRLPAKLY